jgi:hypothetical protein
MTKRKKTETPVEVCEIEISLLEITPRIWRRFVVPADITLAKLHKVIQLIMGWTNSHLHQFIIRNEYYAPHDPRVDPDWNRRSYDERLVKLSDMVDGGIKSFKYEYDFGDGWEHKLQVKKIGPPEANVRYPTCLSGKRACPPEDCGGPWGYEELLAAIADAHHERHEELSEWLGEGFDPEAFYLEDINKTLKSLR